MKTKEQERPDADRVLAAFRETAWIALCYNDHNFKPSVLVEKAKEICKLLGVKSIKDANKFLDKEEQ